MTRENRQVVVDDYLARHAGEWDVEGFYAEISVPEHPAHCFLEWNTEKAVRAHHFEQIRNFVSDLRIYVVVEPTVHVGMPAITVVHSGGGVVPLLVSRRNGTSVSTTTPEGTALVTAESAAVLRQWLNRYGGLATSAERKLISKVAARFEDQVVTLAA